MSHNHESVENLVSGSFATRVLVVIEQGYETLVENNNQRLVELDEMERDMLALRGEEGVDPEKFAEIMTGIMMMRISCKAQAEKLTRNQKEQQAVWADILKEENNKK